MPARRLLGAAVADAKAIRDACIFPDTRKKYTGNINAIKKWISPRGPSHSQILFCLNGELNLSELPRPFLTIFCVQAISWKIGDVEWISKCYKGPLPLKAASTTCGIWRCHETVIFRDEKLEADENQSSSPKRSGKQPLTYPLYKELCTSTLKRNDSGFSHLFLT
ncbi:hypothetical protein L914_06079, partial [Phytophthora nicotianae]